MHASSNHRSGTARVEPPRSARAAALIIAMRRTWLRERARARNQSHAQPHAERRARCVVAACPVHLSKTASRTLASVRNRRLSPVGVTQPSPRRSMVPTLPCEGVRREKPASRVVSAGGKGICSRVRYLADARRRNASPDLTKHPPRTVAKMSESHGNTCSSSQLGGFICLDAYPTIDTLFSACITKEIIA
jgi:hypothetical protein